MKIPVVLFLLTALLPAKTWIELAKEADDHRDHPGRNVANSGDDPRRMEYLKLRAETVAEILEGEPALLPVQSFDFNKKSRTGDFMLALTSLSQLTTLHAKRQEWSDVHSLLNLAEIAQQRICSSEPDLVWLLIASAPAHTAFQCLGPLAEVEDRAKQEAVFALLKKHWQQLRATRQDFAMTEKGETRSTRAMTRDFKGLLRSLHRDLDQAPMLISWDDDFPHQLTVREILEFPLDDEQFRKDTISDLKKEYQWIRSGESFETLRNAFPERPPRPLEFYRNQPNGLGELIRDAIQPHQTAHLMARALQRSRLQELAWYWLSLERSGEPVTRSKQVVASVPASLGKDLETFDLKLLPKERLIIAPDEDFYGQVIENRLVIPKLFPN